MAKSIICGIHAVESAIRNDADNLGQIWLDKRSRNDRLKKLMQLLEEYGLKAIALDTEKLDKVANNTRHQGVVAEYFK